MADERDQKARDREMNPLIVDEYETGKVVFSEMSVTYHQDSEIKDMLDYLRISTRDNGAGKYFVMKTDRWAFDSIDDLIQVLEDFKKRANIK